MKHASTPFARAALAAAAALGLLTFAAVSPHSIGGPLGVTTARADDDHGEHRISKTHGPGRKAARVARHRIGGGRVIKVTESRHDRDRYEVKLRNGAYRYEVELSRHFRVLEVDRDRIGSDD